MNLMVLLSLVLVACSSGGDEAPAASAVEDAPEPVAEVELIALDDPSSAAAEGGQPVLDGAAVQRPKPRTQNFGARDLDLGDWYDDLAERVSPSKDGWPTEVIAQVAERDVQQALLSALVGDFDGWSESLAPEFRGSADLRPDELEQKASDGNLLVRWGHSGKAGQVDAAGWPSAVERLVAPQLNGVQHKVQVWVTSVLELAGKRFECNLSVRIVAVMGEGSQQLNLDWKSIWMFDPVRKRVLLEQLSAGRFEEVEYRKRPFDELTRAVFGNSELFNRQLHQGAVEYQERYDRTATVASVHLGMHGMAVGDVDGNGLEDLYVGAQAGVPNRLFLHHPDGTVREVASAARVDFLEDTAGVLIFDIDGDGQRDIAMGAGNNVLLVWNQGDGRFSEPQVLRGRGGEQVYSLCAADADGDGDLDIYATRYVAGGVSQGLPTPYHDAQNGASNMFWQNEGGREFVLATEEVGLDQNNTRFSLSAIWEDVDRDGDLDLYVVNDFGRNNLYRNDGGKFTDIAGETGAVDMAAGMGVTCADVDMDGDLDFYISNMFTAAGSRIAGNPKFQVGGNLDSRGGYMHHTQGNSLLIDQGGGVYRDMTERARSGPGGWAWGAMFTDFNNNGLPDIVVPNGFLTGRRTEDLEGFFWRCVVNVSPTAPPATSAYQNAWVAISQLGQSDGFSWNGREPNYAYRNLGDGLFADVSGASGLDYVDDGRVACIVDWDGDGRLDLWLKNRTAPLLRFVRNVHATPGHWISIELQGAGANREAAGALVTVEVPTTAGAEPRRLAQRSYLGHGYLGGSSRRLHFGLGNGQQPVGVHVEWPDGSEASYTGLTVDGAWSLVQGATDARALPRVSASIDDLSVERLPARLPESPERWIDGNGARVARVPLLDRLPMGPLELPAFTGPARTVESFAGKNLLVMLWGSWSDENVDKLQELSRELAGTDVVLYPLSLDGVRDEEYVRDVLAKIRPDQPGGQPGGRIDARLQLLFEMLVFEVVGPFDDQPLPLGLLFDVEGALSVLYLDEIDAAEVLRDGRLASSAVGQKSARWPVALTGGRWAMGHGPDRSLPQLRAFLRKQGFRGVSRELKAEERRRGKE
ncbi:MAG: hypothetical protein ACI8QZ_002027 [Chlamydiales bacterium]|jgi:hypothetical protein